MGHAVGQRFLVARHVRLAAGEVFRTDFRDRFARHERIVHVEATLLHLHLVAGHADQPLDVVGLSVAWKFEDDDVAALRGRREDAAGEEIRAERERMVGISVGVFRHEDVVADEESRDHRARRNVEGLEQEGPNHDRDQQRLDHDLDQFAEAAAVLRLRLGGLAVHCHGPILIHRGAAVSRGAAGVITMRSIAGIAQARRSMSALRPPSCRNRDRDAPR